MKTLKGHFLVAGPALADPNFNRAVVLLLQHGESGALGVVVNRPLEVTVRQACEQVLGTAYDVEGVLHHGGPCEAMLMVLYANASSTDEVATDATEGGGDEIQPDQVLPGLAFATEKAAIEQLLLGGAEPTKFVVGYAGWGAGQLEDELGSGSWLVVPATAARVFGPAETLWTRLVTEANLSQWIDPKRIPEDPSVN